MGSWANTAAKQYLYLQKEKERSLASQRGLKASVNIYSRLKSYRLISNGRTLSQ